MNSVKKKLLFALLPALVLVVLVGVGAALGYAGATWRMRSDFRAVASSETLRAFLHKRDRKQFSQAYQDPEGVRETMDDFCYSVPTVMSPFVGCGPEPGKHYNAVINSLQCRADKEVALPKPPRTCRIFLTGGSTAFGVGAPSQDRTIAAYLNALLDKELAPTTKYTYEVFTLANPSWATTHERIMIENRLLELQPDLVISFSGNNDVHWGIRGRNVMWFRNSQEEFNWRVLDWAYGVFRLKRMTDVVANEPQPVTPALVADRLERNVKLSALALGLKNVPYVFCLQPTLAVTRKPLAEAEKQTLRHLDYQDKAHAGTNYFSQCYAEINARLTGLKAGNFTYVNLADAFDTLDQSEHIFLDSYHFGDKGNALIARSLFNRLHDLLTSSQLSAASAP